MPAILNQLANHTAAAPTARKLLVAPDINVGRDLLAALALETGGWIGWEVMTLRSLAGELAMIGLFRTGIRAARDLEITALVEAVTAGLRDAGRLAPEFAALCGGFGFRRALRDAVLQLRVAGIAHQTLHQADAAGRTRDLARVLEAYEAELEQRGLTDPAGVFGRALADFDAEAEFLLPEIILLLPGLAEHGLPGRLAARLTARGGVRLVDPVDHGREDGLADAASVSLFMAASPVDEVREMLRRIRNENRRWDEVEVVATDPDEYGIALDAAASRLDLPVTYLAGLPLGRSRLGRLVARWFSWVEEGLPDHLVREAIEVGDLAMDGEPPSPQLVRLLRILAIGWGRERYQRAIGDLHRGVERPRDPEYPEDDRSEPEWAAATRQLRYLLERLIAVTPVGPEPGGAEPPRVTPAALAGSLRRWLELSPASGEAEEHARARLNARLDLAFRELQAPQSFGVALAALREVLADFRVWPALGPDRQPWSMSGGHLHLTDLAHAGTSGRRRVFVLGLDAERVAGPRVQDPLLPDALRAQLGPALPTTADRRNARRLEVERALASLQGDVTLSWALAADGGREASPAPVLLRIARRTLGQPDLNYETLRAKLSPPASAVPGPGVAGLDARDVWLKAIAAGPILLDAGVQVLQRFPALERGLGLAAAWAGTEITPAQGLVPAAAREDPRRRSRPISASSLELMARCPMAWLYHHAMRLRLPDVATFDPAVWLSPPDRGLLLHAVFERFARAWMDRQHELHSAEAEAAILATARDVFAEWERKIPAPGPGAVEVEWRFVEQSARSFLAMEREARGTTWVACEIDLLAGPRRPTVRLPDGTALAFWGRIDRVDRRDDGSLVVIDFKTGSTYGYAGTGRDGPFRGGRQLQSAVYALAAERLFDARVAAFEYRFPTPRGENLIARRHREQLEAAPGMMLDLLGQIERGEFLPTMDRDDCTYCEFRDICRVRDAEFRGVESPRAEWAEKVGKEDSRFAPMQRRRGKDQK